MWKRLVDAWNGVETNTETHPNIPVKSYDFDQVREIVAKQDPDVVLIDCREPSEFSIVNIPGSINIPYTTFPNAFAMEPATFEQTFNTPKPPKSKELLFFCASGRRAGKAEDVAANNGYTHTALYPGSMNDWVEKGGDEIKFI